MTPIKKVFNLDKLDYYKTHLLIINGILPVKLTPKEIDVLAEFMSLPTSITEDDRFNSLARKKVRRVLEISAGGLGNYLKSMINKGHLIKNKITGRITIRENIFPSIPTQGYMFKIKLEQTNESIQGE